MEDLMVPVGAESLDDFRYDALDLFRHEQMNLEDQAGLGGAADGCTGV